MVKGQGHLQSNTLETQIHFIEVAAHLLFDQDKAQNDHMGHLGMSLLLKSPPNPKFHWRAGDSQRIQSSRTIWRVEMRQLRVKKLIWLAKTLNSQSLKLLHTNMVKWFPLCCGCWILNLEFTVRTDLTSVTWGKACCRLEFRPGPGLRNERVKACSFSLLPSGWVKFDSKEGLQDSALTSYCNYSEKYCDCDI